MKKMFVDEELAAAETRDEERKYYEVFNDKGGKYIKYYKPSVAKLFSERTHYKMREIK
jgi:hypothetical protein